MSPYFIKICGITNLDDALAAIDAGATAIGFNFFPQSKRYIAPNAAAEIAAAVKGKVQTVGIFVNAPLKSVKETGALVKLTYCQLHGDEDPDYVGSFPNALKAFRVNDSLRSVHFDDYRCAAFLLDAFDEKEYGGTGKTFNWLIAREANEFGRIILAGGLTAENVTQAIATAEPWGVDVSSGVESAPGKKDHEKVRLFVERARTAFEQTLGK